MLQHSSGTACHATADAMRFLKKLFIALVILAIITLAFALWLSDKYVVPIIMYHHVRDSITTESDSVSLYYFKKQMEFLKKYKYKVIGLEELVEGIKQGKSFPRKSVVLTFDDGFRDNYDNAFPVLKQYQFPVTMFVVISFLEHSGFLTWEQIKIMKEEGISIESHTMTHAYLPDFSKEEIVRELKESKRILEEKLGQPVLYLAYPIGGFNREIERLVEEAGYKAAFTTNRGYDRFNKDVYALNRIKFSDRNNTDLILWAKLSGFYNLFRKLKKPDG